MSRKVKLTVLIPTYNEEKIISKTLKKILAFLKKKKYSWEVLVVDDGSHDATSNIVGSFKSSKVRLKRLTRNLGKGGALRAGMLEACGEYVIFTDADLSVPINFLDAVFEKLEEGAGVAIGSRRVRGSKIELHQPWYREFMGRVYTFLSRVVTGVGVGDFTCGFKGFSRQAANRIFRKSLVDRWAYDSEILFLAKKYGFSIAEVPVSWKNRLETRVVLNRAVFSSFFDLVGIRLNDLLGKYE